MAGRVDDTPPPPTPPEGRREEEQASTALVPAPTKATFKGGWGEEEEGGVDPEA